MARTISLIEDLGLDESSMTWEDFASCKGLDQVDGNLFYDTYENDPICARQVDVLCSRCPVIKACKNKAINNSEHGVWAATYYDYGKPDKSRNKNKDPDIVKLIESRLK